MRCLFNLKFLFVEISLRYFAELKGYFLEFRKFLSTCRNMRSFLNSVCARNFRGSPSFRIPKKAILRFTCRASCNLVCCIIELRFNLKCEKSSRALSRRWGSSRAPGSTQRLEMKLEVYSAGWIYGGGLRWLKSGVPAGWNLKMNR